MLEVTNNNASALGHAADFEKEIIATINRQHIEWEIPKADILAWLSERGVSLSLSGLPLLKVKQAAAMLKDINDLYVLIKQPSQARRQERGNA